MNCSILLGNDHTRKKIDAPSVSVSKMPVCLLECGVVLKLNLVCNLDRRDTWKIRTATSAILSSSPSESTFGKLVLVSNI